MSKIECVQSLFAQQDKSPGENNKDKSPGTNNKVGYFGKI
jgi:hypothetical protein